VSDATGEETPKAGVPADDQSTGAEEPVAEEAIQPEADGSPDESPADPAPEVQPDAAEVGGDQIEWQPVVDGDQLEWQPVVVSEGASEWPAADDASATTGWPPDGELAAQPQFEYPDGTELEAPWDPVAEEAAAALADDGGVPAAGTAPAATRPRRPSSRPPSRRPPPPEADEADRAAPKTKRQVIILSVLTVVVVTIGVLGFLLSRGAREKGSQATPTTSSTPSETLPRLPEAALQTYTDDVTGFTVKFARNWQTLRAPNADIRLVVNAGGIDAFQVRVGSIQTPATPDNIGNLEAVTDAIVFGDKSAKLVKKQLVTVNSLLAYYYLYTFHDPVSNQEGAHAQYFIFEGNRMFILTFQSVPAEDFAKQASLWDQVAESFTAQAPRATPTTATPPATETTTTAPPTSVP
jgi:hypothetical protein